ncbi:MAG: hypothetical protein JSS02_07245 [Planctomycetes bacterium]|nr:hypothetical protein [Planctomycetota bacterium]
MVIAVTWAFLAGHLLFAAPPVVDVVFPAGGQIGQTVDLALMGKNLVGLRSIVCSAPGVRGEFLDANRLRLTIPAQTPPGWYDLWVASDQGLSAPRTIFLGNRQEFVESEPNESLAMATRVPLSVVVNGRMERGGDLDHYRFAARQGDRVIIECWAERMDSPLRATLEVYDDRGRRLASNRGYFGTDPLVDLQVPADGDYVVRVQDLTLQGSDAHVYRLEIDTGPRVAFAVPAVVERDKTSIVTLFGWNLSPRDRTPVSEGDQATGKRLASIDSTTSRSADRAAGLEHVEVEISPEMTRQGGQERIRRSAAQLTVAGIAFDYPGGHAPVAIGVTDLPVIRDAAANHSAEQAQAISTPCEVSGQLLDRDERDWYAVTTLKGEVLHLEVFGERIGSPVDLQLSIFDPSGRNELAHFADDTRQLGDTVLATSHLDPAGRWVAPADGRFLIEIRNLTGSAQREPRRRYRLAVRREAAAFQLLAMPRREGAAVLNLARGGREVIDVVVLRQRGLDGAIRIIARDLPPGIECPDVWLGPQVNFATVVVSADRHAESLVGELQLEGQADQAERQAVRWATPVRSGSPTIAQRLAAKLPIAIAGAAPLRLVADAHVPWHHHLYGNVPVRHAPGSVVDVAVRIDRTTAGLPGEVKLLGLGLPETLRNATALIPAGAEQGAVSFYLPPTLAPGKYSLTIVAETTVTASSGQAESMSLVSNPVALDVQPAAFTIETDPFAPTQVRRGATIQVKYRVQRKNGFIGKVHTELAVPGRITDVPGLRGRGETFVGQTDRGSLQITVNEDAPLGRQSFLRLLAVGVLEDEPIYQGADLFPLEIVE